MERTDYTANEPLSMLFYAHFPDAIITNMHTCTTEYARYLLGKKRGWLSVLTQIPYRLHMRSLGLKLVLDVGCGYGRYLSVFDKGSIGVDHNRALLEDAQKSGLPVMHTEDLLSRRAEYVEKFDSILISHVLEHLTPDERMELFATFLPCLRSGGSVVAICPQESGFRCDPTHIELLDIPALKGVLKRAGLHPLKGYSFPLPRFAGKFFAHNESVVIAQKI